ncbi:MAG: hypothetical protein NTW48_11210 [Chloroflexi bacterium]|nr:hypothetical protein [Chloroflexota bacterium]
MKTTLGSRNHYYMTRVSILLIMIALIAGMVGCGGGVTRYNLTMAVAGGNGTAIDLTNASPYAAGTKVSIKAVAAAGYQFVNWTAPAGTFTSASAAQTTFTMPAQNVTVTANFALQIRNWYDLDAIRNNLGGNYLLMNNLDSTTGGYEELASVTANEGKGWEPIGGIEITDLDALEFELVDPFTASFDGQGYEIRDLFIDRPDEDAVALFGSLVGATIENVKVLDTEVTGRDFVGILAGGHFGNVSSSCSSGNVSGHFLVGGLIGGSRGNVSDSHSSASVTVSWRYAGGLVGGSEGIVSNSYSIGSVNGPYRVGGLMGGNGGEVSNCQSIGSVNGDRSVGGLLGDNDGTVSNSYSTGSVTGNWEVGGLVGQSIGTVSNCYCAGSVTGNLDVGGLVGSGQRGTTSNSFWDVETSGQPTSDGGTGKTTAEMKNISTFSGAGWNIVAVANPDIRNPSYIWNIVDGQTYPFLSWQPVS